MKSIALALIITTGFTCAIACSGTGSTTESTPGQTRQEPGSAPAEERAGSRGDALVTAEHFVKQFLNFPNNASFGWGSDATYSQKSQSWKATGTVTAMNAFGTEITHDYQCTLALRGSSWTCVAMLFDGEPAHVDGDFVVAEADRQKREAEEAERERKRQAAVERIESDKARIAEEQAADPKAFKEKTAAAELKMAKSLFKVGNPAAERRLKSIAEKYPDTEAAKEARELLESL